MGSSKYPRAMAEYLQSMASPAVSCVRASDDDDGDGDVAVVDEEEDIAFTAVDDGRVDVALHQSIQLARSNLNCHTQEERRRKSRQTATIPTLPYRIRFVERCFKRIQLSGGVCGGR
jgi:hypothetical protein